jgi:hypothetical protein
MLLMGQRQKAEQQIKEKQLLNLDLAMYVANVIMNEKAADFYEKERNNILSISSDITKKTTIPLKTLVGNAKIIGIELPTDLDGMWK